MILNTPFCGWGNWGLERRRSLPPNPSVRRSYCLLCTRCVWSRASALRSHARRCPGPRPLPQVEAAMPAAGSFLSSSTYLCEVPGRTWKPTGFCSNRIQLRILKCQERWPFPPCLVLLVRFLSPALLHGLACSSKSRALPACPPGTESPRHALPVPLLCLRLSLNVVN